MIYTKSRVILLFVCILELYRPAYSRAIIVNDRSDGAFSPGELISLLDNTVSKRIMDSRKSLLLGENAPPLEVGAWVNGPLRAMKWPPDKTTLIIFWSVHCGICRSSFREMLDWAEYVVKNDGQVLFMHAFAGEKEKVTIKTILESHNCRHNVAIDRGIDERIYWNSKTFSAYGVGMLPAHVTISADGRIRSFDKPLTTRWNKQIATGVHKIKSRATDITINLTAIPSSWVEKIETDEPWIDKRILIYRPDTAGMEIREVKSDDKKMQIKYTRHTNGNQTVFEVFLKTTIPKQGNISKGLVYVEVEYENKRDVIRIPFKISKESLFVIPEDVFLGIVEKDKEVSRIVTIRVRTDLEGIKVNFLQSSSNLLAAAIPPIASEVDRLPVQLRYRGCCAGTHKEKLLLEISYTHGGQILKELAEITCTVIVYDRE